MFAKSSKASLVSVIALTATALHAPALSAQTSETEDEARQDTITVTGTSSGLALGAPASFLETPMSTSMVDAETILDQGGTTLLDGLRNVPGVQADLSFVGSHSQVFVLRGSIADNGTQASRILRDGARLTNYGFTPAFVERLNVIRGPGAAAAVRSEPGGTVEVVTKSAEMDNFGSIYTRIGENNAQEYWLDINRILSEEHGVAARGILVRSVADEWRDAPDELNGLKLNVTKTEGDRYRLALDFEATNQSYQPDFGIPGINGAPADVPADLQLSEPFANSETDNRIFSALGDFKLAEDTRLALRYTHMDSSTLSIRNSVFREIAGPPGTFMRVTAYEPDGERDIDAISAALTHVFETGAVTHNLFLGAEYYLETAEIPRLAVPATNNPPINIYNPVFGLTTAPTGPLTRSLTTQDSESVLLSVQDRIEYGAFGLVLGLQYIDDTSLYGGAGTLPYSETRVSPKLGVTYAVTPNQTLYASYTEGTSPQYVATATNVSVPMRTSDQIEAGWKAEFMSGRIQAELAAFQLEQNRTLTPDPAQFGRFFVNGSTRSRGVEASFNGQVTDRLSLGVAYAYTDAEFLEGSLFPGSQTPNVPHNSANAFASMAWDENWQTNLNIYAQGDRFADLANTTVLPGYVTVDLTQAYAFTLGGNPFELQLNVRNLFDEDYFAGSHLHVSRYIMPGKPRTFSVSAMYRF